MILKPRRLFMYRVKNVRTGTRQFCRNFGCVVRTHPVDVWCTAVLGRRFPGMGTRQGLRGRATRSCRVPIDNRRAKHRRWRLLWPAGRAAHRSRFARRCDRCPGAVVVGRRQARRSFQFARIQHPGHPRGRVADVVYFWGMLRSPCFGFDRRSRDRYLRTRAARRMRKILERLVRRIRSNGMGTVASGMVFGI